MPSNGLLLAAGCVQLGCVVLREHRTEPVLHIAAQDARRAAADVRSGVECAVLDCVALEIIKQRARHHGFCRRRPYRHRR